MSQAYLPKVLMVDDIWENLLVLRSSLQELQAEFFTAKNGEEAISLVRQHDFALIILDVMMPELTGYEIADRIRNGKRNRNTPVIFLTAVFYDRRNINKGYQTGAVDYITKPFDRDILVSKVKVFLDLDRLKQELLRSKKEIQDIIHNQTDLIVRTDNDLRIIFTNRAFLLIFNRTYERVRGHDLSDWFDDEHKNRILEDIRQLTPANAILKTNHKLLVSSGQMEMSTIIRALFDVNYQPVGYQFVMRSIAGKDLAVIFGHPVTEKHDNDFRHEEFIHGKNGHPLTDLLDSIHSNLVLLTNTTLDEEQFRYVDQIKQSIILLNNSLSDTISLAKKPTDPDSLPGN